MGTLKIDLGLQENCIFDLENPQLELLNKNFIFGKNGSGKSTLTKLINKNYCDRFDIRIFSGFEGVLVDKKLNALVLGEKNEEISDEIKKIDNNLEEVQTKIINIEDELESLNYDNEKETNGEKNHWLLKEWKNILSKKTKKEKELERFYKDQAKSIKEKYQNFIKDTNYNKNKYIDDLKNSFALNDDDINKYKQVLNEKYLNKNKYISIQMTSTKEIIERVNILLQKSVKESFPIEELSDNEEKKKFAKKGVELHDEGDKCAFCGNYIAKERIEKLNNYFSSKDIETFQEEISNFKNDVIDRNKKNLNKINLINEEDFFKYFSEDIKNINERISKKKKLYHEILNKIEESLDKKQSYLFSPMDSINIEENLEFKEEEKLINKIVKEHNNYNEEIDFKQSDASEKLRLHYVAKSKDIKDEYKKGWKGYEIEKFKFDELTTSLDKKSSEIQNKIKELEGANENPAEGTLEHSIKEHNKLNQKKRELLSSTESTSLLAEKINEQLRMIGKNNFKLELVQDDDKVEHYKVRGNNGLRNIQELSTGERNIIAFLYFIETLQVSDNNKNKIIILDDPMNSNDDSMQYLIITEIQKLYHGAKPESFNNQKDYLICLTHNVHFYLNVQPHGNFKEKAKNPDNPEGALIEKTKYDKNGFYSLKDGKFNRILSEKEDFRTHYEHLWIELEYLYKYDMVNSMLNCMRRIIETFMYFNKFKSDKFYKNYEEHRKLFNVNSHGIEDFTADIVAKNKETIFKMFKELFQKNNSIDHYNNYRDKWKTLNVE